MRTVAALEVRQKFGQIIDEAAAGERIVIERAGQPICAIVPLSDLEFVDPDQVKARRLRAIEDIKRMARERHLPRIQDTAALVRQMREERTEQIARAIRFRPR